MTRNTSKDSELICCRGKIHLLPSLLMGLTSTIHSAKVCDCIVQLGIILVAQYSHMLLLSYFSGQGRADIS